MTMKSGVSKQLIEDLSDLEQAIEDTAYNAVFSGIRNAMRDLGFEGDVIPPKKEAEVTKPQKKPKETMKVRARGRKGRKKPAKLPSLTDTQKELMKSIQKFVDEQGKSPTYTELAKDLNKSGVATIVHAVVNKGWIRLDDSKYSRKIELLHRV